ncbi:MAG: hypothetical protein ACOCRO_01110 [Halanaerobiales bacterium]
MLIEVYHVVSDQYKVSDSVDDIEAGNVVRINSDEEVELAEDDDDQVIGLSGDAKGTDGPTTDYSEEVIIGAGNTQKYTQNRVSDFYNETLGSDMITVYHGGGKFYVSDDIFTSPNDVSAGDSLQAGTDGVLETDGDNTIAMAVGSANAYPSGVPGTDTNGHMELETPGNNTWIPVVLRV